MSSQGRGGLEKDSCVEVQQGIESLAWGAAITSALYVIAVDQAWKDTCTQNCGSSRQRQQGGVNTSIELIANSYDTEMKNSAHIIL